MKQALKWIGLAAAIIGAIDLLYGNTAETPLPSAIGNQLTQQTDLFLIAGGGAAFFFL